MNQMLKQFLKMAPESESHEKTNRILITSTKKHTYQINQLDEEAVNGDIILDFAYSIYSVLIACNSSLFKKKLNNRVRIVLVLSVCLRYYKHENKKFVKIDAFIDANAELIFVLNPRTILHWMKTLFSFLRTVIVIHHTLRI